MSVKTGIVGLPNVGKSTLFNSISSSNVPSENFPFCTIEPNESIVNVPDKRLELLRQLVKPQKIHHAPLHIVDIAGLVPDANKGEGLGHDFLKNIETVDQIMHVVRCFDQQDIIHVEGRVDPCFDKLIIDQELRLKDLATLTKKLKKIEKIHKDKAREEKQLIQTYLQALQARKNARDLQPKKEHLPIIKTWQLLTQKPVIYVANVDEATLKQGTNTYVQQLKQQIKKENATLITLCATLENQLDKAPQNQKQQLLDAYNLKQTSLNQLIQASYKLHNLITYFTAGPKEVRAWPIPKNTPAPQAAAIIHTDLQKKFIKAQVIKLKDYLYYKTEKACQKAGKITIQGKKYLVQDADIIHFICKNTR